MRAAGTALALLLLVSSAAGCLPSTQHSLATRAAPGIHVDPFARSAYDAARAVRDALALNHGGAWWDVGDGPLALWVQPRPAHLADGRHAGLEFQRQVAAAAHAWTGIVRGLRFAPTDDSASAAVRVVWRHTLPRPTGDATSAQPTAGRTTLSFTSGGRTVAALVELALHATPSSPYAPIDVRAVAQHELGHVLGLAHHAPPTSIMAAEPRVASGPSRLDREALRRLYERRRR